MHVALCRFQNMPVALCRFQNMPVALCRFQNICETVLLCCVVKLCCSILDIYLAWNIVIQFRIWYFCRWTGLRLFVWLAWLGFPGDLCHLHVFEVMVFIYYFGIHWCQNNKYDDVSLCSSYRLLKCVDLQHFALCHFQMLHLKFGGFGAHCGYSVSSAQSCSNDNLKIWTMLRGLNGEITLIKFWHPLSSAVWFCDLGNVVEMHSSFFVLLLFCCISLALSGSRVVDTDVSWQLDIKFIIPITFITVIPIKFRLSECIFL